MQLPRERAPPVQPTEPADTSTAWPVRVIGQLSPLQSSFANPGIVKVLHGCAQDALWLRRDFGLLLCNVFDTAVASRLAHCPSSSYAALVAHFFSATLPKEHQLSDWSMRPLDPERESYARHDTHYLLPLYDRLLALLHQRDGQAAVDAVFEGAHDLVTREWTDPTFTERGAWRRLLRALRERSDVDNPTQEGLLSQHRRGAVAFIRLSKWRFEVAKREDLSPKFLLSDPDLLYVSLARPEGVEHVRDAAATSPGLALVSGGAEAVAALLDAVRSMPTDDVLDFVARCPTFGRVGAESGAAGGSGRSFDRSKPLYSNTQLVAPDGTVLAKIGAKKAAWYVKMDLVDQVAPPADAPGATVLRLKFAPKGRGNAGDAFALGEKLNRCVVCGVGGSLRRSYVVPRQFRALFPHEAKANMSHDVVLACGGCHSVMQRAAASLVAELKDEAGVGSAVQPAELAPLTDELKRMVSFGKALRRALKGQHQLPPARRAEMEATVRRFVGAGDGEAITLQHLDKVDELYQAGLQRRRDERSAAGSSSAELIVAALVFGLGAGDVVTEEMRVEPDEATQRRLKQFVKRFRERFVEQVRPKHLPDGWSVDYKVMRGLSKTVRLQKEQEAAMRRGHSGVGGAGGAGGSATPDAQDDSGGDSSGDDDADDDDA